MIVLTGSSGLIGRATTLLLQQNKVNFLPLDSSVIPFQNWIKYLKQKNVLPKVIIHLAAVVPKPPEIIDTEANAILTKNIDYEIYKMMKFFDCYVIYISGCSLYPLDSRSVPIGESNSTRSFSEIASPYLRAKKHGEELFLETSKSTILRVSTPIGCGLSNSSALGIMLKDAGKYGFIRIWEDGTRSQNYIDAQDVADAIFKATKKKPPGAINIANEVPTSMMNLANEITRFFPNTKIVQIKSLDLNGSQKSNYSIKKAKKILDWAPKITLRESLEKLINCI